MKFAAFLLALLPCAAAAAAGNRGASVHAHRRRLGNDNGNVSGATCRQFEEEILFE